MGTRSPSASFAADDATFIGLVCASGLRTGCGQGSSDGLHQRTARTDGGEFVYPEPYRSPASQLRRSRARRTTACATIFAHRAPRRPPLDHAAASDRTRRSKRAPAPGSRTTMLKTVLRPTARAPCAHALARRRIFSFPPLPEAFSNAPQTVHESKVLPYVTHSQPLPFLLTPFPDIHKRSCTRLCPTSNPIRGSSPIAQAREYSRGNRMKMASTS